MTDREQVRRDAHEERASKWDAKTLLITVIEQSTSSLRVEARIKLDALLAELEQAERKVEDVGRTASESHALYAKELELRQRAERERDEATNAANRAWNVVLTAAGTNDPDVAEARLAKVPALVEALRQLKLASLLQVRRAAFAPQIGVRYTEAIRSDIEREIRALEQSVDAALAAHEQAGTP